MNARHHLSPRTSVVLHRGLMPLGLLAGMAAPALIVFGAHDVWSTRPRDDDEGGKRVHPRTVN